MFASAQRMALLLGLLSAVIVGYDSAASAATGTQLSGVAAARDEMSWGIWVDTAQSAARDYVLGTLKAYSKAASRNAPNADSLRETLQWLISRYTEQTGITDLRASFNLRQGWSPAQHRRKLELDSLFHSASIRFGARKASNPDSAAGVWLDQLAHFDTSFAALNDTAARLSVLYYHSEVLGDLGRLAEFHRLMDSCAARCAAHDLYVQLGSCRLVEAHIAGVQEADYYEAERASAEAAAAYHRIDDRRGFASGMFHRAFNAQQLNHTYRALPLWRTALEAARRADIAKYIAYCVNLLAETYLDLGEPDSAMVYAEESRRLREQLAYRHPKPAALKDLGNTYSTIGQILQTQGDQNAAARWFRLAALLFQRSGDTTGMCLNKGRWAALGVDLGHYAEAEQLYRFVIEKTDKYESRIQATYGLAVCLYARGQLDDAATLLKRCIARHERTRSQLPDPGARTGIFADKLGFYNLLTTIWIKQYLADPQPALLDSALACLERSKAQTLREEVLSGGQQALEGEDVLRDRLSRLDQQTVLGCADCDSAALERQIAAIEDSLYLLHLAGGAGDELPAIAQPAFDLSIFSQSLDSGLTVLEYLISPFGNYLFVIDRDTIRLEALQGEVTALDSTISEFLKVLAEYPSLAELTDRTAENLGRVLYEALLPSSVFPDAPPGKICVVGAGAVERVPFAALVDGDGHFLVERTEISYAPSLTTRQTITARGRTTYVPNRVTVFGDPQLPPDAVFSDLPDARLEAAALAEIFGEDRIDTYVGVAASKSAFIRAATRRDEYIHVATHGVLNMSEPDRSALVLTAEDGQPGSGMLYPRRIAELDLQARSVFLSACYSGGGTLIPGEGVMSLVRPFLVAGCRSVVASLWSIDDRATAVLVTDFYRKVRDGATPAVALAEAQRAMIHSDRRLYRHPFFWSAFTITGAE